MFAHAALIFNSSSPINSFRRPVRFMLSVLRLDWEQPSNDFEEQVNDFRHGKKVQCIDYVGGKHED